MLHLPVIVDAAESSPAAAREAANRIRKFLAKDNFQRAYVQYNAIMLVRILADNPGKTFTKNLDAKFSITVKELLRDGRDMSVQQILRETLDSFETQKAGDETLTPLIEMWKKEKVKWGYKGNAVSSCSDSLSFLLVLMAFKPPMPPRAPNAPAFNANQQNYFARSHKPHGLPPPDELAQRIEEAKTSSKLLLQVVQSTPPAELIGNELIKEFVERCQSASRSVQGYIHADNPPPDEDTLLTLIETNDQLSTAISRHQRALLQARRVTGAASSSPSPPIGSGGIAEAPGSQPIPTPIAASFSPPPGPPPRRSTQSPSYDPFDDRHEAEQHQMDIMHAPLEPQNYGLPPRSMSNDHYSQPGLYQSEYQYQSPSSYADRQHASMNDTTMRGAYESHDPVSPEEARKPVMYRF